MLLRLLSLSYIIHIHFYVHIYSCIFMYASMFLCMYTGLLSELYMFVQLFYVSLLLVSLKAHVQCQLLVVSFQRSISYGGVRSHPHLQLLAQRSALPPPPSQWASLSVNGCSWHFHCRCILTAGYKDLLMETVPLGLYFCIEVTDDSPYT